MTPTATDRLRSTLSPNLAIGEVVAFAYDTFCSNKVRFMLTALGMVIGTASLILVVTVGLTARQYVFNLIQGIGANLIWVEYKGGGRDNQQLHARSCSPSMMWKLCGKVCRALSRFRR